MSKKPSFLSKPSNLVGVGLIITAIGLYGYNSFSNSQPQRLPTDIRATYEQVDTSNILEMAMGEETAPVTITEYASFTCSHCADFATATFPKLKKEYIDTGKVRFVQREIYTHQIGLAGSLVARCDGGSSFFEITKGIFDNFDNFSGINSDEALVRLIANIGTSAGLSQDKVEACMADEEKAEALVAWSTLGQYDNDIRATPTFIINGETVSNRSYEDLKVVIDRKIAEATSK